MPLVRVGAALLAVGLGAGSLLVACALVRDPEAVLHAEHTNLGMRWLQDLVDTAA